jgi:hypothetical protein
MPGDVKPSMPIVAFEGLHKGLTLSPIIFDPGGTMRHRILPLMWAAILMTAAHAQQSHWATPGDKSAKFMIDMERKWAEGVCTNNGVISELLADDFQGTSTRGGRYNKTDELRDEKGAHWAHGCALDDANVRFLAENVAIIYGSEHAIGKDKMHPEAKQCQVWTDTWLKRDGKWRIVAAQDNKVDCKH